MNKLFQNTVYITNLTRNEYDEIVEFLQLNGYTKNNSFSNYNNSIIGIYPYMCFTHINGNINSYVNESFKAITIKDLEKVGFRQNKFKVGSWYINPDMSNMSHNENRLTIVDRGAKYWRIGNFESKKGYTQFYFDAVINSDGVFKGGLKISQANDEFEKKMVEVSEDVILPYFSLTCKNQTLSKENLLEEAKRRYPKGTRYRTLITEHPYKSENQNSYLVVENPSPYYFSQNQIALEELKGLVYVNGVWADIIEDVKPVELPIELLSLPEKWCIRFNNKEQYSIINKYFDRNWYFETNKHENALVSYKGEYIGLGITAEKRGLTEITFEQFKKWVLKEDIKVENPNNFKVGDLINCYNLTGSQNYEISKIEGDDFWIYNNDVKGNPKKVFVDYQKYKFSNWPNLKKVEKEQTWVENVEGGFIKDNNPLVGYNVSGDIYVQKPSNLVWVGEGTSRVTFSYGTQVDSKELEFQEPVIFKSKNKKSKLIII